MSLVTDILHFFRQRQKSQTRDYTLHYYYVVKLTTKRGEGDLNVI